MILEFSCPGGAREPISPTQLPVNQQKITRNISKKSIIANPVS